jgi:Regulators of stationary/sporulation gene expression
MARGIIRKIDELGRVTIPIEIRRATGINSGIMAELYLEKGIIHLRRGKGRKLDELGRYTIPIELRRSQGWKDNQELEMYVEGKEICIRKEGCDWCDSTENLITIDGHKLCTACIARIKEVAAEVMEGMTL